MNKDNQPGQIYKLIILTGLVLFVALVGYKIISSYIQENKEKAIIQERAKAQQVLPTWAKLWGRLWPKSDPGRMEMWFRGW